MDNSKKLSAESSTEGGQEIFDTTTTPFLNKLANYFSLNKRVLIIGCGQGVEIDWLAKHSQKVTAIDISSKSIKIAQEAYKSQNVECILISGKPPLPFDDKEFDIIFMHDVCEHIIDIECWFFEYHRVLKDNGVFINQFAPLFYSPYGGHLKRALKLPWGHLIFGLRSVIEVRNRVYPPSSKEASTTWAEWGLNRITESKYNKVKETAGFEDISYSSKTSMNVPLVRHIPFIKNLFIMGVENILRKQ